MNSVHTTLRSLIRIFNDNEEYKLYSIISWILVKIHGSEAVSVKIIFQQHSFRQHLESECW